MNLLKLSKSKATVVVGLDFGTTFSGFAYALPSAPDVCHLFYEWPQLKAAGASNYCKTQTSLLYSHGSRQSSSSESHVLQGWGHDALVKHAQGSAQGIKAGQHAHFVTRFKLYLAGSGTLNNQFKAVIPFPCPSCPRF